MSALRLSGRPKLVTLRSSSLSVGSNPKMFWKTVKDLENKPSSSQLPMSINVDDVVVTDRKHMAELFNHHLIKSGFLFDSDMPPRPSNLFLIFHPF